MSEMQNTALVTAVHKERFELLWGNKRIYAKIKTSAYADGAEPYPTTGDRVQIRLNETGDSLICKTEPRTSYFSRLDPDKSRPREQAVAANFDYVFVMASLNHDLNPRRIERYLTLAWQSGAAPFVILTKADLCTDWRERALEIEQVAAGVAVLVVSVRTGQGLEELRELLQNDKTVVLLGSSGVGKSSLLNALAGESVMAVSGIREDDSKGRHTTTHRQMVLLSGGARIIDTPGMRELGMWEANEGLSEAFADIDAIGKTCKFSDCKHQNEPGCAVRAAIQSGSLSEERLNSYRKLCREMKYVEDRAGAMRDKRERNKSIARRNRKYK